MGLSDSYGDGGGDAAGVRVSIEPVDAKAMKRHAASELLKAVEAKDVSAIEDALDLHHAACQALEEQGEYDKDDEGNEDEE